MEQIKEWRFEWFPLMAFVTVLVLGFRDLADATPWLVGFGGLFVLVRATTAKRANDSEG